MKNILIALAILIVGSLAYLVWHTWGERYTVEITEAEIVEKLNKKFPFEKNYFLLINLRFSNPKVELEEGSDRIRFGCDVLSNISVNINSEEAKGSMSGTALLSGELRYESSEGAFYLDKPIVEKLEVKGLPQNFSGKVNSAASKLAKEYLSHTALYHLKATDIKQAAAKLVMKSVKVKDKKLIITLGIG